MVLLRPDAHGTARLDLPGLVLIAVVTIAGLHGLSRAAASVGFDTIAVASLGVAILVILIGDATWTAAAGPTPLRLPAVAMPGITLLAIGIDHPRAEQTAVHRPRPR